MPHTDLILAIDQGTSSTKTVVFDTKGRIVAKGSAPLACSYPRPGLVEQSPQAILNSVHASVRACLKALDAQGGRLRSRIACCGITNQRETFLLWDREGRPQAPVVVWQDNRSAGLCEAYKAGPWERQLKKRAGLIADPYFSGTKLRHLLDNDRSLRARVKQGKVLFGTVDSWVLYNLTKGKSHRTDFTNACRTLLFNINTLSWDRSLVAEFASAGLVLPEAQPSSSTFGATDVGGLLPSPVEVTAMIGDSHAAAFGQGCFAPGSAKITMGTGSSILMNTGKRRDAFDAGMMSTICWSVPGRTDYALEGIIISCGSTLNFLRDQMRLYRRDDELEGLARAAGATGGVYVIPSFTGMGAPFWVRSVAAGIVGLTFGATREQVVRAGLESIVYQIRDCLSAMQAGSGVKVRGVSIDGGISRNAFVAQYLSDVLGVPVAQAGIAEVTAKGVACLAGLRKGIFPSLRDVPVQGLGGKRFTPSADRSAAKAGYAGWQDATRKYFHHARQAAPQQDP